MAYFIVGDEEKNNESRAGARARQARQAPPPTIPPRFKDVVRR